jgi:hypothetical protein
MGRFIPKNMSRDVVDANGNEPAGHDGRYSHTTRLWMRLLWMIYYRKRYFGIADTIV